MPWINSANEQSKLIEPTMLTLATLCQDCRWCHPSSGNWKHYKNKEPNLHNMRYDTNFTSRCLNTPASSIVPIDERTWVPVFDSARIFFWICMCVCEHTVSSSVSSLSEFPFSLKMPLYTASACASCRAFFIIIICFLFLVSVLWGIGLPSSCGCYRESPAHTVALHTYLYTSTNPTPFAHFDSQHVRGWVVLCSSCSTVTRSYAVCTGFLQIEGSQGTDTTIWYLCLIHFL